MKISIVLLFFMSFHIFVNGQSYNCPVGQGNVIQSWREEIIDSHFLGSTPDGSTMSYCPEYFTFAYGGSYTLNYIDQGGSGMDAYPNVIIGSAKIGGAWQSGNVDLVGMPVTIANIPDDMCLEWKVSQENALDASDKWMASINFIFDITGTQNSEPIDEDRDYDLVIKSVSHNFTGDDLVDKPITTGDDTFWYFARETNGSIKPYTVEMDGVSYTYAVRYKFFQNSGDKDDKVHLKFIPFGTNGAPSITKINIKEIIAITKSYIPYANLPTNQLNLANSKVALNNTWLKSINAGYEVYSGQSVLKTEKFKVYPQGILGNSETEFEDKKIKIYPNPSSDYLSFIGLNEENPSVEIIDSTGKLVQSTIFDTKTNYLSLQNLASGMYWVKVSTQENIVLIDRIFINN